MNCNPTRSSILSGLVLTAALVAGCSSGSGGDAGTAETGMAAIVLRDGTIQSNDGRVVTSVFVEISRITIESDADDDHDDGDHEDGDEGDDDGDDGDEDGDGHDGEDLAAGLGSDGDDDEHGDDDDQGEDDDQDGDDDGDEVVVFDMDRDNGGAPRVIDLLTLTDSGVLFNMLRIPVGTYDEATVTIVGASALFADDPTQTPVVLAIESDGASEFEFDFEPPVVVTKGRTSVAAIDIVPVITFDGSGYTLSHDDDTDESGGCGDGDLEIEVEGTVTAIDGDRIELGQYGLEVDLSHVGATGVSIGDRVEVEGYFEDGVLVAQSFELDD